MYIVSNSGKLAYGIKSFLLDTKDELAQIDRQNLTPGSTVYITKTKEKFILNNAKEWDPAPVGSSGGSSGGGDTPSPGDTYIYDGGSLESSSSEDMIYNYNGGLI